MYKRQDTNRSGKDVSEDMEEPVDTTPKATAIFWVDKDKDYQAKKKDGPLSPVSYTHLYPYCVSMKKLSFACAVTVITQFSSA